MSYDNSQLARVSLHAWILTSSRSQAVTGKTFFRTITEEILDYVMREMLDESGGSYSTQDADSEGEEGKFFVWTPAKIREILRDDAEDFMAAYGVTPGGNFEAQVPGRLGSKNILEFVGDLDQRPALAEARRRLFEAREKRVHPGRDEKVLTSWRIGRPRPVWASTLPARRRSPIQMGFVHFWADRRQDLERQTGCEEEAIL